jgi:hypothetical protein
MNTADADILDALIQALAQQNAPLPQALQQEMAQVGRRLAAHNSEGMPDSEAIEQLLQEVKQYPPLQDAYDTAYRHILNIYHSQERTKSMSEAVATPWTTDLKIAAALALTAENPIETAKWLLRQRETASQETSDQWERGRSVLVMIAGGTYIGSMIAQVPGAIVGGILGAAFAWFYPNKASYDKN